MQKNKKSLKDKKNKSTIYINGRFLTQKITGVQRYAIEVVKQLDKINRNYNFILLTPNEELKQKLDLKHIKTEKIGKLKGHLWEQISLPIYLRKKRQNKLLNLCNIAPMLLPGYVTIHDIAFKTHPQHLDKKFALWYRVITAININRYKHIYTVSEFSKNEIIKNYNINKNKITVAYNSAEHLSKVKKDDKILEKLQLVGKKFYFSLGSKSPHKNFKYIEECAKINSNSIFVVGGRK